MRSFNPGRIDPTNAAWNSSRKPLVAHWETPSGTRFFTINLHLTAKLGGTSTQGDARPPINTGVAQRTSQVKVVAVSRSHHLLGMMLLRKRRIKEHRRVSRAAKELFAWPEKPKHRELASLGDGCEQGSGAFPAARIVMDAAPAISKLACGC